MKKLNWKQNLRSSILTYPIETVAIVYGVLLGLFQIPLDYPRMPSIVWGVAIAFLLIHGIQALTYNKRCSKKPIIGSIIYTLSAFSLIIPTFFNIEMISEVQVTACLILSFLFYLFAHTKHNNISFANYSMKMVINACLTLLFGFILWSSITLLYMIFYAIFSDVPEMPKFLEYMVIIVFMGISPLFWLILQQKEYTAESISIPKFIKIVFNIILSPALIIYAIIILVYTIRIIINWNLPNGIIAVIMFGFLCSGFILHVIAQLIQNNKYLPFYKYLPYFTIIPIILLWISLFQRINAYSLTEVRVYTLYFALLASCVFILLMFYPILKNKNYFSYKTLLIVAFVIGFISTFIPQYNAKNIAIHSQRNNLTKILSTINQDILDNKYKEPIDSITKSKIYQLKDVYRYLNYSMGDTTYLTQNHPLLKTQLQNKLIQSVIDNRHSIEPDTLANIIVNHNNYDYAIERRYNNDTTNITNEKNFDYIKINGQWFHYNSYTHKIYINKMNQYNQIQHTEFSIPEAQQYLDSIAKTNNK